MNTFGKTLRTEREDRGLTIQDLSEQFGVGQDRLLALERNDFGALPDDATMTPLLRTYAASLGVEAELMIEDYKRERERCLEQLSRAVDSVAPNVRGVPDVRNLPNESGVPDAQNVPNEPDVPNVRHGHTAPTPRVHRQSPFPRLLAASIVAAALASLGLWWIFSGEGPPPVVEPPTELPSGVLAPVGEQPARTDGPAVVAAAATPVAATRPSLSIPEYGVGTAVRNMKLVGERNRFDQGTQVWFWTRVQGGQAGERIDHVWLEDGVEAARISLKLGGERWRTHSAKTIRSGSARNWTVEARDSAGRVLARREFVSVP